MKKNILLFLLLSITITGFSQDFDAYLKNKNDNYSFPNIPAEMNFQEFHLLSQTFRMQDMIYSAIVPGYVHFKAQENKIAYGILATRTTAFIALSDITYRFTGPAWKESPAPIFFRYESL